MTALGRSIDEIADEIRYSCGCSKLGAYRLAHGMSQPEVAARYREATAGFMDQPLLSRLEQFPLTGSHAPNAAQLIALAAIYGTAPLRLVSIDTLNQLDPHEKDVLVRCNTAFVPHPQPSTRTQAHHTGDMRTPVPVRRAILAHDIPELERQIDMAARRALRFSATAEGTNVGPETLEQLRAEVCRLALSYPQQPLPTLLGDLVDMQDVSFRLLEGRQRPNQMRDLYFFAGVTSGMLAKASHDLGDPHAAMTQARTGYVCADNADHDGLRVWMRGLQSLIAYWAGWPHEAIRYAQLGDELATQVTGTAAVWLPALAARAWAVLAHADEARAAVEQANTAREQVVPDDLDQIGGLMTFTRPRQLYYAADATVWLPGEEEQTEREASEAIAAYENADDADRSFSDEAGARSDLALARAASGEIDGAREALRPVLDLPPAQRIGGIIPSTLRVHAVLRSPRYSGSTAARDIQEEIEEFCQVPAAATLTR